MKCVSLIIQFIFTPGFKCIIEQLIELNPGSATAQEVLPCVFGNLFVSDMICSSSKWTSKPMTCAICHQKIISASMFCEQFYNRLQALFIDKAWNELHLLSRPSYIKVLSRTFLSWAVTLLRRLETGNFTPSLGFHTGWLRVTFMVAEVTIRQVSFSVSSGSLANHHSNLFHTLIAICEPIV
jgi:hypothetical protein